MTLNGEKLLIFVRNYKPTIEDLFRLLNKTDNVSKEELNTRIKKMKRDKMIFGYRENGKSRYALTTKGIVATNYMEKAEKIISLEASKVIEELDYDLRVEGTRLKSDTLTRTEINEIAKEISRITTFRIKEKYNVPESFDVFFNCDCDTCNDKESCPQRIREMIKDD